MSALVSLFIILAVLLGIILIVAVFVVGIYNGLVRMRNAYKNAFSQIEVQLKRRHDLIPNLVETAKGYLSHERETLEAVISARNVAAGAREAAAANPGDPGTIKQLSRAEAGLGGVLGRLFAVAEAYPDLKANHNMMQLSEELTTTENKVAFARQAYNDAVMTYNNKREVFPNNLVASTFNFAEAAMFEIEDEAQREAPKVEF